MLKIVQKLWSVGAPPYTPLRELTALPQIPYLVGRELLHLPKNANPALGLRTPMKNCGHTIGPHGTKNTDNQLAVPVGSSSLYST